MLVKIKQYQQKIMELTARLRDVRVIGLLFFLVILLLISWSGVKAIDTNYQLQRHISALQQQNDVQKLSNTNLKLQNDYLNTPQYLELAARQDFGLAAPGETVLLVPRSVALAHTVDLPPQDQDDPAVKAALKESKKPAYQRNFDAWMDFFLHRQHSED